eukprot:673651_1
MSRRMSLSSTAPTISPKRMSTLSRSMYVSMEESMPSLSTISSSIQDIPSPSSRNNIRGMIFVTFSVILLLAEDALFKYASNHFKLSLLQCIFVATLTQHALAWMLWFLPPSITRKECHHKIWCGEREQRLFIFLRGFFMFCDDYFYFRGILLLSLGDAEAIYFLCPIFVAFAARIFFKEHFSKCFPFILVMILIGLTVLCQPKWLLSLFGSHQIYEPTVINPLGVIFILMGCVSWALMSLMVKMVPNAHWIQFELVSSGQSFAIWVPLLMLLDHFVFEDFHIDHGIWSFSIQSILFCMGIGLLTLFALMFLVVGYQQGEATKVAFMEYVTVPVGYLYQYILSGQTPNVYETTGAIIIVGTSLIGMFEEYYDYYIQQDKP